jgi:hypothetical protein
MQQIFRLFTAKKAVQVLESPMKWDVVLGAWCAIGQATCKFPIPHVPTLLSEFRMVLVGARVREDSAKVFKSWIFTVLYKFKTTTALLSNLSKRFPGALGLVTMLGKLFHDSLDLVEFKFGGMNGIHSGARWGHLGYVALLHDSGASVDSKDEVSWTPLAYAHWRSSHQSCEASALVTSWPERHVVERGFVAKIGERSQI